MGGLAGVSGAGSGEGKVYAVKVSDKQYLINKGKVRTCLLSYAGANPIVHRSSMPMSKSRLLPFWAQATSTVATQASSSSTGRSMIL